MRFTHLPLSVTLSAVFFIVQGSSRPLHIVLVVIDDYGWSDVGFHGSKIHTPNMDKLAAEGVILDNYYVQPICSPTRSALLSGRYPIHTGLQHGVIRPAEPYGLPLDLKTLPEMLQKAGYETHIVGKWHLGFYEWPYTPTYRGFHSFYGFYTGSEDHFNHEKYGLLDLHDNKEPVRDKGGFYSARLFAQQAQKVVLSHNASAPLFLYLPFQNVHGPTQAPQEYVNKYQFIDQKTRREYAAMVDIVDEAIGNVTQALEQSGLWNDTLLIVTTDNGGIPSAGGYNWPLRGHKGTLWEGGLRGVGFVHGKMLKKTGVKCTELLHVTDWYPTLLYLAGLKGGDSSVPPLDGFNIWQTISEGAPSPRTEILHNIDLAPSKNNLRDVDGGYDGIAIRVNDMKLLMNVPNLTWYKPPELFPGYQQIFEDWSKLPTIEVALYNITADPTEHVDLSKKLPDEVEKLKERVQYYMKGVVPSLKKPADEMATKVAKEKGYWGPWRT
ncbi:arylsulfatase B-like isoform X2 [Stylophora pistillata]|uniref:arylsulfatase B-like isoform X2 n=1 Tax=Stylophora pistillata TaxID=50429 RepID=UPI000C056256|nr:arylsulfatase B-like isoform X2 [Stylophora pistillata]